MVNRPGHLDTSSGARHIAREPAADRGHGDRAGAPAAAVRRDGPGFGSEPRIASGGWKQWKGPPEPLEAERPRFGPPETADQHAPYNVSFGLMKDWSWSSKKHDIREVKDQDLLGRTGLVGAD